MKKTSYKDKPNKDLLKALSEKRVALRDARFGAAGSKARDPKELKVLKKDIARIMTELNAVKSKQ